MEVSVNEGSTVLPSKLISNTGHVSDTCTHTQAPVLHYSNPQYCLVRLYKLHQSKWPYDLTIWSILSEAYSPPNTVLTRY